MLSNSEWIQQLALSTVSQSLDQVDAFKKQNKKFERENKQKYNLLHYGNSSGISEKAQGVIQGIGATAGAYAMSDASPLTQGLDSGISVGLNMLGPWGMAADAMRKTISAGLKAVNANIDGYDSNTWTRLGGSKGADIGNKIFAGIGIVPSAGKVADVLNIDSKAASAASGTFRKATDMASMSGKGLLFGLKNMNARAAEINKEIASFNEVARDAKKMESNYAPQLIAANNQMIYNGNKPGLTFNKKGGTIPELEEVRAIMQSLQSKQTQSEDPQKFQLGGKMNMIVTGALHARKHNLEELNPDLEGNITKKGIPVVVMEEGGEVIQSAEVEEHEIILASETTKTVEEYYKEYENTDSKSEKDNIALECGKYLVDEILKNTDDPDKLIKKTE